MSPLSLEYRLNRRISSGIVALVLVFGVLLGVLQAVDLSHEFDRALESKAHTVVDFYRIQPPATRLDLTMKDGGDPSYLALRLRDGSLREPTGPVQLGPNLLEGTPLFQDITLPGGEAGRQVEIAFTPGLDSDSGDHSPLEVPLVTLIVAEPLGPLRWRIFYVSAVLAAFWTGLLLALRLLVRRALQHGLEPVVGLKRQLETLDVEHSSHRVRLLDPPGELIPVVHRINQLLRSSQSHPVPSDVPGGTTGSG